ncbi:hypothetical protein RHMOL_Rhmol02G0165500 [Rhododendron molle]|uniref:Uncharacterized protein n=1 Tax=Rhododendron molle TaxID=49168 RepID=A0ACC0PTY4_RHOML|nr:hypothetical protein RHMOL_Rhmol02G0165500 [Rhododendron molle]
MSYVAESEVKDSKFTKEEIQLIEFVMKPARKKEDMKGIVSMDGMIFNPSRTDLHNVFKERGRMSNSLFLPILLATSEHWFCVVINLIDKRINVLDSMKLKSDEKTFAIADVVSVLFTILKRTRPMEYPWTNWLINHADVPQQNNLTILQCKMEHIINSAKYDLWKVRQIDGGDNDSPPHAQLSPVDAWLAHHKATTRDDLPVIHMRGYRGVMSRNSFRKWRRPSTEPPPAAVGRREDQQHLLRLDYTLDWNQSSFQGDAAALLNWPLMFEQRNKLEAKCRKYLVKVPKACSAQMIDGRSPNRLHDDVCEQLKLEINAMWKRLIVDTPPWGPCR